MRFRIMIWASAVILLAGLSACAREESTAMVGTLERDRIELVVESNEPITGDSGV